MSWYSWVLRNFFNFTKLFEKGNEVFLGNKEGDSLVFMAIDSQLDSPDWLHYGFCVESAEEVTKIYMKMKLNEF